MLRFVTYNVRGFFDGKASTVPAIASALKKCIDRPERAVVCLNEVALYPRGVKAGQDATKSQLAEICDRLGMKRAFFGQSNPDYADYGNAIMCGSDVTAVDTHTMSLEGGTTYRFPGTSTTKRIIRGVVLANLRVDNFHFGVLCTHLDHLQDTERRTQVEHLLRVIRNGAESASFSLNKAHCICGDINAISRADYNVAEWRALEERHMENKWSPPDQSAALAHLLSEGEYVDAFKAANSHVDIASLPSVDKFSAHGIYRIDYGLLSPELAKYLSACSLQSAAGEASDHVPLTLDITVPQ